MQEQVRGIAIGRAVRREHFIESDLVMAEGRLTSSPRTGQFGAIVMP